MIIKKLETSDHASFLSLLESISIFTADEKSVVIELLETYLFNPNQKDYLFYVSKEESGVLSSFICFGPTPMTTNTYDLYWIATHPEYRCQGLALKLIEQLKTSMREVNAKIIRIETSSQELYGDTVNFYQRHHFQKSAQIPDFYKDNDDLIIYTMRL